MTSPGFLDYFNPAYDVFSVPISQFTLPFHWDFFLPDNQDDFACRSVIAPSPERGATRWTKNGKYICVGVYRDEGRPTQPFPARFPLIWSRIGNQIIFTDPLGHGMVIGDKVNLANVNLPVVNNTTVINVFNAQQFAAVCSNVGPTAGGGGSYQPARLKNFYDENVVFRLLPSFQVVPYQTILDLFTESAPAQDYSTRYIRNLTTDQVVKIPQVKNDQVDYTELQRKLNELFREATQPDLRFNQAFDENGEELEITYNEAGYPVVLTNVDSRFANAQVRYNQPRVRELPLPDESVDADDYPYVYDFYGFEVNDVTRDPFFENDLITRNPDVTGDVNNLLRKSQNGQPLYASPFVQDTFGNKVIGIQESNATVVRKQVLPLALDIFNRPNKLPYTRVTSS